jgi:hypothetical protein
MGFAVSVAFADWRDFIPTPFENSAYLETFGLYERDSLRSGSQSSRWDDTFIRERLTLLSDGYSYDPRFLQYHFSIAGLLRQENYDSSLVGSTGWTNGTGTEFDARLVLLPEHTYNLTVFASRYQPLFKEQSAVEHNAVGTTYGASVRYRKKPYFLHLGTVNDHIDSGQSSSDVTRLALDSEYFKRFTNGNELSFNGGYDSSWFSNSEDLTGTSNEYSLGNMLNLRRVRLTSNASKSDFNQESATTGKFKSDQLSAYTLLNGYLPWNFRTNFSYRYRDNTDTIQEPDASATKLSDKGDDIQLDVSHRLYESLDTTYTFLRDSRNSSGGDTAGTSNALTMTYTKRLPAQSRWLAGIGVSRTDTDSSGAPNVLNQPFPNVAVPGSITLPQQNADPTSIVVFLQSPLLPFQLIELTENAHYAVIPVGNSFEIRIFSLPPQFVVPGTYDFSVTYSLTAGNFSLRYDTISGNASAQLFADLVTPYFGYVHVASKVLSGAFPGIPIDSTTYTTGLILHPGPVRLLGEYQELQWDVSPYRAYRAEVQYVTVLNPTTDFYATASYLNRYYPHGSSAALSGTVSVSASRAYTEEVESVSANIQKQLPSWNMYLALGGGYSRLNQLIDTDAYTLNGSWTWHIAKVDLSIGASAYASGSSGGNTVSTRRDHEIVYFNLRRRLF